MLKKRYRYSFKRISEKWSFFKPPQLFVSTVWILIRSISPAKGLDPINSDPITKAGDPDPVDFLTGSSTLLVLHHFCYITGTIIRALVILPQKFVKLT